jgi:MFS family permease
MLTCSTGCRNWLWAIGAALLCEKLGRRPLWLTSAIGMLVCYISITACSAVFAEKGTIGAGYAVIAFIFLYNGSYSIAFTGLTLAYPNEILPFNLRSKGNAILQLAIQIALFFNQYVRRPALPSRDRSLTDIRFPGQPHRSRCDRLEVLHRIRCRLDHRYCLQ